MDSEPLLTRHQLELLRERILPRIQENSCVIADKIWCVITKIAANTVGSSNPLQCERPQLLGIESPVSLDRFIDVINNPACVVDEGAISRLLEQNMKRFLPNVDPNDTTAVLPAGSPTISSRGWDMLSNSGLPFSREGSVASSTPIFEPQNMPSGSLVGLIPSRWSVRDELRAAVDYILETCPPLSRADKALYLVWWSHRPRCCVRCGNSSAISAVSLTEPCFYNTVDKSGIEIGTERPHVCTHCGDGYGTVKTTVAYHNQRESEVGDGESPRPPPTLSSTADRSVAAARRATDFAGADNIMLDGEESDASEEDSAGCFKVHRHRIEQIVGIHDAYGLAGTGVTRNLWRMDRVREGFPSGKRLTALYEVYLGILEALPPELNPTSPISSSTGVSVKPLTPTRVSSWVDTVTPFSNESNRASHITGGVTVKDTIFVDYPVILRLAVEILTLLPLSPHILRTPFQQAGYSFVWEDLFVRLRRTAPDSFSPSRACEEATSVIMKGVALYIASQIVGKGILTICLSQFSCAILRYLASTSVGGGGRDVSENSSRSGSIFRESSVSSMGSTMSATPAVPILVSTLQYSHLTQQWSDIVTCSSHLGLPIDDFFIGSVYSCRGSTHAMLSSMQLNPLPYPLNQMFNVNLASEEPCLRVDSYRRGMMSTHLQNLMALLPRGLQPTSRTWNPQANPRLFGVIELELFPLFAIRSRYYYSAVHCEACNAPEVAATLLRVFAIINRSGKTEWSHREELALEKKGLMRYLLALSQTADGCYVYTRPGKKCAASRQLTVGEITTSLSCNLSTEHVAAFVAIELLRYAQQQCRRFAVLRAIGLNLPPQEVAYMENIRARMSQWTEAVCGRYFGRKYSKVIAKREAALIVSLIAQYKRWSGVLVKENEQTTAMTIEEDSNEWDCYELLPDSSWANALLHLFSVEVFSTTLFGKPRMDGIREAPPAVGLCQLLVASHLYRGNAGGYTHIEYYFSSEFFKQALENVVGNRLSPTEKMQIILSTSIITGNLNPFGVFNTISAPPIVNRNKENAVGLAVPAENTTTRLFAVIQARTGSGYYDLPLQQRLLPHVPAMEGYIILPSEDIATEEVQVPEAALLQQYAVGAQIAPAVWQNLKNLLFVTSPNFADDVEVLLKPPTLTGGSALSFTRCNGTDSVRCPPLSLTNTWGGLLNVTNSPDRAPFLCALEAKAAGKGQDDLKDDSALREFIYGVLQKHGETSTYMLNYCLQVREWELRPDQPVREEEAGQQPQYLNRRPTMYFCTHASPLCSVYTSIERFSGLQNTISFVDNSAGGAQVFAPQEQSSLPLLIVKSTDPQGAGEVETRSAGHWRKTKSEHFYFLSYSDVREEPTDPYTVTYSLGKGRFMSVEFIGSTVARVNDARNNIVLELTGASGCGNAAPHVREKIVEGFRSGRQLSDWQRFLMLNSVADTLRRSTAALFFSNRSCASDSNIFALRELYIRTLRPLFMHECECFCSKAEARDSLLTLGYPMALEALRAHWDSLGALPLPSRFKSGFTVPQLSGVPKMHQNSNEDSQLLSILYTLLNTVLNLPHPALLSCFSTAAKMRLAADLLALAEHANAHDRRAPAVEPKLSAPKQQSGGKIQQVTLQQVVHVLAGLVQIKDEGTSWKPSSYSAIISAHSGSLDPRSAVEGIAIGKIARKQRRARREGAIDNTEEDIRQALRNFFSLRVFVVQKIQSVLVQASPEVEPAPEPAPLRTERRHSQGLHSPQLVVRKTPKLTSGTPGRLRGSRTPKSGMISATDRFGDLPPMELPPARTGSGGSRRSQQHSPDRIEVSVGTKREGNSPAPLSRSPVVQRASKRQRDSEGSSKMNTPSTRASVSGVDVSPLRGTNDKEQ